MSTPVVGQGFLPASGNIAAELSAVTRRAFVPRLVVQIYKAAPLLSLAMRNAQRARGGLNKSRFRFRATRSCPSTGPTTRAASRSPR